MATAPVPVAFTSAPPAAATVVQHATSFPVSVMTQEVPTAKAVATPGRCTAQRVVFWVAAALSWLVWALSVTAGAGNDWFKGDEDFKAASEKILELCEDADTDLCDKFEAFSAVQIIATVLCSIAMVFFVVALFRPDARCTAVGGASVLFACAIFQIAAVGIVVNMKEDAEDDLYSSSGYVYTIDLEHGDTFGAAVAAFCLAIIDGIVICALARASGEGLVYSCLASGSCGECCGGGTPHAQNAAGARTGGGQANVVHGQHAVAMGTEQGRVPPPYIPK